MTRPRKCRRVGFIPDNPCFHPQLQNREEVILDIEEVEALRLADYLELDQDCAAESMNVSRGTFQRIINSARKKTAEALIHGKILRINGGNYLISDGEDCCRKKQGICKRMNCNKCAECFENKSEVSEDE